MKNSSKIVRPFREDDFPSISQLWTETGMGSEVRGDDRKSILRTLGMGGHLFVLEDSETNEIIGTSWLTQDGRRIYLHHFCIKPGHQGKGYARLLLKPSLEVAKSTGLQIKLEVHRANEKAVALYEKAGFQYLGDYLVYIIRDLKTIL